MKIFALKKTNQNYVMKLNKLNKQKENLVK